MDNDLVSYMEDGMNIINFIKNPRDIIIILAEKNILKISDKRLLKILYKNRIGKKLDLKNPNTFNEKLQWLKLYDRNPDYTKMVDKYEAKKYISNLIGEEYIIPTLGVYNNFDEIDFDKLPNEFVMKCTHDSGGNIICKDKTKLDFKVVREKIERCLKRNYYNVGREWPYKNVKPRIIVEKYMEDKAQEELKDYKFMSFNGKVKCSFVCSDRYGEDGLKVDFYDLEWNKMPFQRHYPNSKENIQKPKNYELMIQLAEKLSNGIPFVRVDFYEINGKVYFGELTFFPGSGFEEFTPEKYDRILGDMLELPKKKREEK